MERIEKIADLLSEMINSKQKPEEVRALAKAFNSVKPGELALAEQKLKDRGFSDELVYEHIHDIFVAFQDVLLHEEQQLPSWHPIQGYLAENNKVQELILKGEYLLNNKFIPNEWAILCEELASYNLHLVRKQNQLYPALEKVGFDRPSKIMWTLDNKVRDLITNLRAAENIKIREIWNDFCRTLNDLIGKENQVLYPTSLNMLTEDIFKQMRLGDEEIGYFLDEIPPLPPEYASFETSNGSLVQANEQTTACLPLLQGKMTLKQIQLMLKHLPVDLSFVDENELVCFYSDTKKRIFPRSPGVIGRNVRNCHPRESLDTVVEMLEAFKAGRENEAEFWLEVNGAFIYIYYTAVRDESGRFMGVLEMMQDVTHIRSLQGSQRLLSWNTHK